MAKAIRFRLLAYRAGRKRVARCRLPCTQGLRAPGLDPLELLDIPEVLEDIVDLLKISFLVSVTLNFTWPPVRFCAAVGVVRSQKTRLLSKFLGRSQHPGLEGQDMPMHAPPLYVYTPTPFTRTSCLHPTGDRVTL